MTDPKLWDAIEAQRPDCCFVYITHDLGFLSARPTAAKFVVRSYSGSSVWEIEEVPRDADLPERVMSELMGSRQPVLFVEGDNHSIDTTIYRGIYAGHLIQSVGSCGAVIHAVTSFSKNASLHRIGVRGCIDADAREPSEIQSLQAMGIHVLPVAEIENLLLLPTVFRELAKAMHFTESEATSLEAQLLDGVVAYARSDLEAASVRYAVRRLDAILKTLGPTSRLINDLNSKFNANLASVNPGQIADIYREKLEAAINSHDMPGILMLLDNKGLLSLCAHRLGMKGREPLVEFVGRLLGAETGRGLQVALQSLLPAIPI